MQRLVRLIEPCMLCIAIAMTLTVTARYVRAVHGMFAEDKERLLRTYRIREDMMVSPNDVDRYYPEVAGCGLFETMENGGGETCKFLRIVFRDEPDFSGASMMLQGFGGKYPVFRRRITGSEYPDSIIVTVMKGADIVGRIEFDNR